jgi:hypothetical protein
LVDLEQQGIARLELDGLLNELGVGDRQIVTMMNEYKISKKKPDYLPNNLEVGGLVEVAPGLPVVLGERIFDADDGVLLGQ